MSGTVPDPPNPADVASAAGTPAPAAPPVGVGDAAPTPAPAGGDVSPPASSTAPQPPALEPSLLESFTAEEAAAAKAADTAKAAEKPAADPTKPAGDPAKPAGDPAAPPVEGEAAPKIELPPIDYKFETPAGVSISTEQGNELKTALDAFRADPEKGVQSLIDLHAKAIKEYAATTLVRQYEVFNETRKGWQQQVLEDAQLGGSGHKTVMRAAARMRDRFVPADRRAAFESFLRTTGAGDHPEFIRLLHNVAGAFDEPPLPPPNVNPPPDLGRKSGASKAQILYGK